MGRVATVTSIRTDGRRPGPDALLSVWRGLSADARRLSRNDLVLRKLMARTVVALSAMTDWTTLTHQLDVARPTVNAYVDVPGSSFAGKDYESITKALGREIMVTRRDVDVDQPVLTVPAGVLLALLG